MKYSDIRDLSQTELEESLAETQDALNKMKFVQAITPVESTAEFKNKRKTIARMLTEIRRRELGLYEEPIVRKLKKIKTNPTVSTISEEEE